MAYARKVAFRIHSDDIIVLFHPDRLLRCKEREKAQFSISVVLSLIIIGPRYKIV